MGFRYFSETSPRVSGNFFHISNETETPRAARKRSGSAAEKERLGSVTRGSGHLALLNAPFEGRELKNTTEKSTGWNLVSSQKNAE